MILQSLKDTISSVEIFDVNKKFSNYLRVSGLCAHSTVEYFFPFGRETKTY